MGVLAIDIGTRKTGFAFVDDARLLASPLDPVRTDGDEKLLFAHIRTLLKERQVSRLLVGLPLARGEETDRSRATRALIERLRADMPGLAISTHDEHLTTKEAESRLRERGYTAREIRTRKDSWAALVLLEDWLAAGEPR